MYRDGKNRKDPRPEEEQNALYEEIERIINDFADEIVEALAERGIKTRADASLKWAEVREASHEQFAVIRRRTWELVKGEIPSD